MASFAPAADLGLAESLARLAVDRDAEAWSVILRLAGEDMRRLCARIVGNAQDADDAVQETLLQIRDAAGRFVAGSADPDQTARRWIMGVAAKVALMQLRTRARLQRRERVAGGEAAQETGPSVQFEKDETSRQVRAALAALPERLRTAVSLRHLAGMEYAEIAALQSCSETAVRIRVHRGLDQLRRRLAPSKTALTITMMIPAMKGLTAAEGAGSSVLVLAPALLQASSKPAFTIFAPTLASSIFLTPGVIIMASVSTIVLATVCTMGLSQGLSLGSAEKPTSRSPIIAATSATNGGSGNFLPIPGAVVSFETRAGRDWLYSFDLEGDQQLFDGPIDSEAAWKAVPDNLRHGIVTFLTNVAVKSVSQQSRPTDLPNLCKNGFSSADGLTGKELFAERVRAYRASDMALFKHLPDGNAVGASAEVAHDAKGTRTTGSVFSSTWAAPGSVELGGERLIESAELSHVVAENGTTVGFSLKEGKPWLNATNAAGEVLFDGPFSTPEEQALVPEEVALAIGFTPKVKGATTTTATKAGTTTTTTLKTETTSEKRPTGIQ